MRKFSVQIIIRTLLIVTVAVFLGLILFDSSLVVNQVIFVLVLIGLIVEFLNYTRKVNRRLSKLFEAIMHADFAVSFNDEYLGKSFKHLNEQFAYLIEKFKKVKIEKEQQFQLLSLLIESIPIGIVAVRQNGEIILFNSSVSKILDIPKPNNWKIFNRLASEFVHQVDAMGDFGTQLLEIATVTEPKLITVTVSTSQDTNGAFRLITIKNIQNEIEQKELEAWHSLIRVLTHEMMNSLTPISSLSETMLAMLKSTELDNESIADLRFSLEMIGNRSNSMIDFLEEYRRITRVPKPVLEEVSFDSFLQQVKLLTASELKDAEITLMLKPTAINVMIDAGQMELVFLNLIKNSRQALVGVKNPIITIAAKRQANQVIVTIEDNGTGIETKAQGQIFIPFFTTKEAGSGIGLSLSRQILKLHQSYIHLVQTSDSGTVFELALPIADSTAKEK